jgi:glycerol-3-phosphate dehydrogenase
MMVEEFHKRLSEKAGLNRFAITAEESRPRVLSLNGLVDTWQQVVDIGHVAGGLPGIRGVVNDIRSKDAPRDDAAELALRQSRSKEARSLGQIDDADVVIIGCGVSGAGVARQLARYDLRIVVLEKTTDISEGTTKANNGMIHPGHDPKQGSLKAILNVKGNAMYDQWAEELRFLFRRTGCLLCIHREEEEAALDAMFENAQKNGVPGVRMLSSEEAMRMEPNMLVPPRRAMSCPSAGFVEPYEVVEALIENAMQNGVKLMLETEVLDIDVEEGRVKAVLTTKGLIAAKTVINAAGLYADDIAAMVDDRFYTIHPRKGALLIFDRRCSPNATFANMSSLPSAFTKGGGNMITPTDNHLWGPSAKEIPVKDNFAVDDDEFEEVIGKCYTKGINSGDVIAYFSGVRAPVYTEDFIVEASEKIKGFIHVAGMQSPALASAPAVAELVERIYLKENSPAPRKNYNPRRKAPIKFSRLNREEQNAAIKKDPRYGHIVCRCETVSEAEVVEAIHGLVPARTMDAVKRRTRCGMGRCHGGFCGPRVMDLIAKETGIPLEKVTKRGLGTEMLAGENRRESGGS